MHIYLKGNVGLICETMVPRYCSQICPQYLDLIYPDDDTPNLVQELCPPPWGVDILFLLFSPSVVRCPASDVRRHAWFPLI